MLWVIFCFLSLLMFVGFLSPIVSKWNDSPIITSVDSTNYPGNKEVTLL
jgi:hypothetical protein